MSVQIDYNDLKQKVNAGWKRDKLAEHYGLKDYQMRKALKDCGLKIRKFHKPAFIINGLPGSENEITQPEVETTQNATSPDNNSDVEETVTDEKPTWK